MDTQNTPVHIKLWNHSFWHLALANMFLTSAMTAFIPIFAMWFIVEGISELSLAISAGKFNVPYWWTLLILSILEIVFGFLTFFDPIGGAISMAVMVGTFLIVHGISMLGDWIVALRVKKFFKGFFQRPVVFNDGEVDDSRCDDQR